MAGPYPQYSEPYPGLLPPPVPYPKRSRWRVVLIVLAVLVVVAGVAVAVVFGVRSSSSGGDLMTGTNTKTAIQNYLDALADADVDTISRNTLCGLYDAVHDKRSDQALAKLSSEAFRKQFSRADVTSIDKIVYWSSSQAQVLFTMRVTPATRGAQSHDEQGIAQILAQDNHLLICSYLLRTATMY
ncbi:MAG: hypothetical protein JO152_15010 [Mycobacteriaceae bacterium]|nr:hypothetical protein [Mycobacteriaceae bacterium]